MTELAFACETCRQVHDGRCPDGGSGASVHQIKQALRMCPTVADVNDTARHFGWHVAALDRAGGSARVMAIQIRNMAAFRRREMQ